MDAAVTVLRTTATLFIVVAITFGVYLHRTARIAAGSAAVAAAAAAVQQLDLHSGAGWDCTQSGPNWDRAVRAAAEAAAARTAALTGATATAIEVSAGPACVLLARVTVGVAGVRSWLEASALACRPAAAAGAVRWGVDPPC